ncbi:hypothetical protein D0Z07_9376 [Hyphodiscus hymeniophilus]|uniref:Uncharacterized protein n=1 Tax=Hyphodiscus hymeniophilus TaxID=353542 RepID=A0A9P6SPU5_9HELO|nr:hypothetical protein D0Z07_9376 [Hyphodiscus hymeniophilus]
MPAKQEKKKKPATASIKKSRAEEVAPQRESLTPTKKKAPKNPSQASTKEVLSTSSMTKKSSKHMPVKLLSVKSTPAKQRLVKKDPMNQNPTQLHVMPTQIARVDGSANIWTAAISRRFYRSIDTLFQKLNQGARTTQVPENYRTQKHQTHEDSKAYALLYEEELHLADHFAFLAQVEAGPGFVSAVTIEESYNPPCFTVRLASNESPTPYVKEGLEKILQVVRDHAHKGRNRDTYRMRLLDEVVDLSQKRIYARLRCAGRGPTLHDDTQEPASLSSKIQTQMLNMGGPSLKPALLELIELLNLVETAPSERQTQLLKDVIHKSYAVSHQGNFRSLATNLRAKGVGQALCERREVLEIDKLSKYLEICNDLIRLSRQPSTSRQCLDMRLEILPSYTPIKSLGSPVKCHTHAEVQLVLFYEQYPTQLPPRAIGSSKSACFLCDMFIQKHGSFGISHSHMKLYRMWTIPDVSWMSSQQIERFQNVVQAMAMNIETLVKENVYQHRPVIESRAHILQISQASETASSVATSTISEAQLVDYIFDFEEVDHGRILVSECRDIENISDDLRVNVRSLSHSELRVHNTGAPQGTTFHVHDDEEHELRVSMIWNSPPTQ